MELQDLIICIELGIIAITGILIAVLLSKLFNLLKRNHTPELFKLLRDAVSNKTNQTDSRISAPVQRTPMQATPMQVPPVQATPVQRAPMQAPPVQAAPVQRAPMQATPVQVPQRQNSVAQEVPAESIQEQLIKAEIPREIGIVFCRNCGQSFLSNQKACPHCKAVR